MTRSNELDGVKIASSGALAHKAWYTAGFGCLVMLPIAIGTLVNGELIGLFFVAIPIAAIGLAIWTSRITPATFVTLYSDRLVLAVRQSDVQVVRCADIEAIRWPAHGRADVPIRLRVRKSDGLATRTVPIGPGDTAIGDRATLIGYLHLAASEAKHENWSEYCVRCAVPLLDRSSDDENRATVLGQSISNSPIWNSKLAVEAFVLVEKHPFIGGLFMPIYMIALATLVMSREAYWMTASAIVISTIVNIRLWWGQWISPFTEICLGFAAALLVLGCSSPPRSIRRRDQETETVSQGEWWLLMLIVGGPMLGNAAQARLVPNWFAKYVLLIGFYGMLLVPVWLAIRKRKLQVKRDAEPGSEALKRWAAFESGIQRSVASL